jgi:hypothetical protein
MESEAPWSKLTSISDTLFSDSKMTMQPSKRLAILHLQYKISALLERRRDVVRHARSLPKGAERNQFRKIASSIRSICRDSERLNATIIGVPLTSTRQPPAARLRLLSG